MKKMLLAAVVSLVVPNVSYGQAPDPRQGATTPVQVVNTLGNPVPVTGTLDVNVVNQPALQPVTVKFAASINTTQAGFNFLRSNVFYTVPAGKRLVIEYVDVGFFLPGGSNSGKVSLTLLDTIVGSEVTQHVVGVSSESIQCTVTQTCLAVNRLERVYVDGGRGILADGIIVSAQAGGLSFLNGTVNGYLVDVP